MAYIFKARNTLTQACIMLAAGFAVVASGCDSNSVRRPITGLVKTDGELVGHGSITLLPDQGHRGPAASSSIVDGRYRFTSSNGPTAGNHRVIVGIQSRQDTTTGNHDLDESLPESSSIAKQGPVDQPRQSNASTKFRTEPIVPTKWETTVVVPAAGSPGADEPVNIELQSPVTNPKVLK